MLTFEFASGRMISLQYLKGLEWLLDDETSIPDSLITTKAVALENQQMRAKALNLLEQSTSHKNLSMTIEFELMAGRMALSEGDENRVEAHLMRYAVAMSHYLKSLGSQVATPIITQAFYNEARLRIYAYLHEPMPDQKSYGFLEENITTFATPIQQSFRSILALSYAQKPETTDKAFAICENTLSDTSSSRGAINDCVYLFVNEKKDLDKMTPIIVKLVAEEDSAFIQGDYSDTFGAALDTLGWLYYQKNDYQKALSYAQTWLSCLEACITGKSCAYCPASGENRQTSTTRLYCGIGCG